MLVLLFIMYNTDTPIEGNMVPYKKDTVQCHGSEMSLLPSEKLYTSITSEYDVFISESLEQLSLQLPT